VRGRGAAVTNLSHRASFHSKERIAPANRGIKHLGIAPSLRPEFVARAFGFQTATGFRETLEAVPDREHEIRLSFQEAADFARSRGFTVTARSVYDILATIVMVKEASRDPEINDIGYGNRYLWPESRHIRDELAGAPVHMQGSVRSTIWRKRIDESRAKVTSIGRRDGLLHALAYASRLEKIKTTQEKGSYVLKHRAEETPFRLFGDVVIGHNYVSNTDMIIAMLHLGFQMNGRHRMEERLNPRFNYSMKSVNSMKPYSVRDKDAA
jgi:hypothetical protein